MSVTAAGAWSPSHLRRLGLDRPTVVMTRATRDTVQRPVPGKCGPRAPATRGVGASEPRGGSGTTVESYGHGRWGEGSSAAAETAVDKGGPPSQHC